MRCIEWISGICGLINSIRVYNFKEKFYKAIYLLFFNRELFINLKGGLVYGKTKTYQFISTGNIDYYGYGNDWMFNHQRYFPR